MQFGPLSKLLLSGVALAMPWQASGQATGEGTETMTETGESLSATTIAGWDELLDTLHDLPRTMLARLPEEQRGDPQVQQEAARLALAALGSVTIDTLGGDPDFPQFLLTIGPVLNVGQPNADTTYRAARIDPAGIYRLTGTRGTLNQAVIGQVVPRAAESGQGRAHLDLNAVTVDAQDRFEVMISAERPAGWNGDWWQLRPAANRLLLRLVRSDWANEVLPTLSLERLDIPMRRGRVPAEVLERRLRAMPQAIGFLGPMFVDRVEQMRREGFVHRFKSFDITSAGGLEGQNYYESAYDLTDDEALVIETPIPEVCPYRSLILTNQLYETTDWYDNHSSLNGHQSPPDSDGIWRVVVSARDPGIRNWLDTAGYPVGMIQGRWTHCSETPIPTITKVAFGDIDNHFPAGVARVTAEEREAIVRARRSAYLQRGTANPSEQSDSERPPMDTAALARAYYRAINAAELEPLLELFTDDVVFRLPDGRMVEGRDALRRMYTGVFAQSGPQPQPVRIVPSDDAVAVEVEVHLSDGSVRKMSSFFEVAPSGKFSRVSVYQRS